MTIQICWELVREWLGAGAAAFLALKAAVKVGVAYQIGRDWWRTTGKPWLRQHGLLLPKG